MSASAPHPRAFPVNPNVGRYLPLMVTRRCNLACDHCSVESSPDVRSCQPSEQELLQVVRQAAAAGVQTIQFTGGEPMLREKLVAAGATAILARDGGWSVSAPAPGQPREAR